MSIDTVARILNVALGVWLFVSIFVWPHTTAQAVNAALVGMFVALTALSALSSGPRSRLRILNGALAVWLLVSIGAFPTYVAATRINSAIVAVLVFVVALIPRGPKRAEPRPA